MSPFLLLKQALLKGITIIPLAEQSEVASYDLCRALVMSHQLAIASMLKVPIPDLTSSIRCCQLLF
jgi:hypothetical protein